jgi:hypothetical protein
MQRRESRVDFPDKCCEKSFPIFPSAGIGARPEGSRCARARAPYRQALPGPAGHSRIGAAGNYASWSLVTSLNGSDSVDNSQFGSAVAFENDTIAAGAWLQTGGGAVYPENGSEI